MTHSKVNQLINQSIWNFFKVVLNSDCNPGIEFSVPKSGIEKFVIPGSQDPVSGSGIQIDRHFGIFK